ncbi:MAG: PQQ-binding-like beta-propeller repeat protein [Mycobacterium sp.]|nr:PQQ-binding-like beta-propeller repeat protein [Mycobacterium sp.]
MPNATLHNTRDVTSQINSSNVKKLGLAWSVPLTHAGLFGYYANTPVFNSNGTTVYLQDLAYNVFAVDAKTGRVEWTHSSGLPATTSSIPEPTGEGPNGVAFSAGKLYGETPSYAFALDAATGHVLWRTPNLAEKKGQGFNTAPQVANGRVYLSTSGQLHGGVAYALDARTGKVVWSFQETKNPTERTAGGVTGTGGAWNAPAIGPDGTVYFGIGNPYRSINDAITHPTKLLYNNSTIALTPGGNLKWYFQAGPNDFHDWDMQISPIYTTVDGQPVIIDGGKMGRVYAMNANTGKLLWNTPVGKHNGHDNDSLLALEHKPFHPSLPYTYYPGIYGGIETNMAVAGGVVYVPVVNLAATFKNKTEPIAANAPFSQGTGEMVALSLTTGKVVWDHRLPSTPYGDATVTNDLVFTTTFNGNVIAFSRATGAIVWQAKLPAATNAAVAINGDTLITAGSFPSGKGQKPEIVAYRIGATGTTTPNTTTPSTTTTSSNTKTAVAPAGTQVLKLAADPSGALKYNRPSLTAKAGKITIEFTNRSPLPHNVAVQKGTSGGLLGTTPTFQGGTKALTLVLPAGKYTYYCSVPGHRQAGMLGTLTVTGASSVPGATKVKGPAPSGGV